MNKKNLSVVMAGAMLATSVAPVLAATETSVSIDNKALLTEQLVNKMESKTLSDYAKFIVANKYMSNEMSTYLANAKSGGYNSVYGIKVKAADGTYKSLKTDGTVATCYNPSVLKDFLKADTKNGSRGILEAGDTIEIYERENNEFYGEILPGTAPVSRGTVVADKYTKADFIGENAANNIKNSIGSDFVKDVKINEDEVSATVVLKSLKDITDSTSNNTIQIKVGDAKLDGNLALDAEGEITTKEQECVGFAAVQTWSKAEMSIAEDNLVETIKITKDADSSKVSYLASDLYDGFALTAGATEIVNAIGNDKYTKSYKVNGSVAIKGNVVSTIESQNSEIVNVTITVESAKGAFLKEYTIYSTNKNELKSLMNLLLAGDFNVGIVGGDNRYETAVNVDKAMKRTELEKVTNQGGTNIVLVNGTSLVDGLAAAPLASTLTWAGSNKDSAPVLLSETDKLPTATKEYIEELVENISPASRKLIEVTLVGGKSVLSETLVDELEGMGFTVKRLGGDDREETSLKVAKAINSKSTGYTEAFVVGANGEADAMSIAAVAAENKAPIIVSSVHGLSEDAVEYIKEANVDATIIGGEGVVSKEEETTLDESISGLVTRVSGANRFETNAAIIEKYYANGATNGITAEDVVLVKDGQKNEDELVDALSAANYAALNNAPVVLASTSLKDYQKNALLKTDVTDAGKVSQIGIGAERTVLEAIADLFDISNL